jgi:hypothetical protein
MSFWSNIARKLLVSGNTILTIGAVADGEVLTRSGTEIVGSAGGGGTPGGADTQVQFNDGGAFGGDSGLVFNKTTNALTTGGVINSGGNVVPTVDGAFTLGSSSFPFASVHVGSEDGNRTALVSVATTTRTATLPNKTGTVAFLDDITGGITNSASTDIIMKSDGTNAVGSNIEDDGSEVTISVPTQINGDLFVQGGNTSTQNVLLNNAYQVSTLPAGTVGQIAFVNDGDAALAWGATVVNTGAGATIYLVFFNGTNWTVAGK